MGPGSGAQRRRFGEPGLSSAASNSMGRFNVAPHAMPPTGQGPGADAALTAAQSPPAQRSSRAKPAPMAPPAPGSRAGPASCDVTGVPTARPGVGRRKRAAPRGPSAPARRWRPLLRKWNGLGGELGHRATRGRPRLRPSQGSSPSPSLAAAAAAPGGPSGFRTCAPRPGEGRRG